MTHGIGFLGVAALAVIGLTPAPAQAELVFFTTGRVMSVAGHEVEADAMRLHLRGGGEIVCPLSLIARIAPNEIPDRDTPPATAMPPAAGGTLDEIIDAASARHDLDPALVRAVIQVESAFEPTARSWKGAMGLMQLMPATAAQYAVGDPFDPHNNVKAGTRHLKSLLDRFGTELGLAAYNAGAGAVQHHGGMPPYRETRDYVARILRLAEPRQRR